jgi:CrcB protein
MNLGTALLVGLAGGAGSVSRYLIGVALAREQVRFPVATILVNVLGAFLIGLLMVLFASRGELDSRARIALTTGFLGGFTTYSAFAYETVAMVERREYAAVSIYIAATLVAAALACWGGMAVARAFR